MGKYLVLWETDMSRVPEDPKEQLEFYAKIQDMCKEDQKSGTTKDFGMFLGGDKGYTIEEGTEEEIAMSVLKYSPFVRCAVHQVISSDQVSEIMKKFASL